MTKKIVAFFSVFVWAILCLLILACLFFAILPIFAENTKSTIGVAQIVKISAFTLFQAILSTAISLFLGIVAAFFTARRIFFGRKFLLSLSSVPFCVPALIVALGYVCVFGMNGTANKILMGVLNLKNPPLTFLYSFGGLILTQGFYNFPIAMKTVGDAWAKLPSAQANAARILGASEWRIFRTLTIFQLSSAIVSASLPIFIYCFMSFILVLMFGALGTTTLEVEIYRAAKILINLPLASKFAIIETAVALFVVILQCVAEEKGSRSSGILADSFERQKIKSKKEIALFWIFAFFVVFGFLFPLFGIALNAFFQPNARFLQPFKTIVQFGSFFRALKGTFFTGILTATLCTVSGFVYAVILSVFRSTPIKRALPMIPLAISSVVFALGLLRVAENSNFFLLVLAQSALNWPFAFRQIYAQISKIPPRTKDAAKILSPNPLDAIFRLYLPVSKRGIFSAAGFCFALSAGDTTLPLVLALPDFETLSLFTYRLAGAYRFHEACASGLLLGAFCAIVFALSSKIGSESR